MSWAAREADKRNRHATSCQCLGCIGPEQYVRITAEIRADLDAGRFPERLVRRRGQHVPQKAVSCGAGEGTEGR